MAWDRKGEPMAVAGWEADETTEVEAGAESFDESGDEGVDDQVDDRVEMRKVGVNRRRFNHARAQREERQRMIHLASLMPKEAKAIILAILEKNVPLADLALIHHASLRTMRRRVDRLRELLKDHCFLLAAKHADTLPGDLGAVAKAYWLEGLALRELAARRRKSLHCVRQEVAMARVLLAAHASLHAEV